MIETRGAGRCFARWVCSLFLSRDTHQRVGGLSSGKSGYGPRSAKPTVGGAEGGGHHRAGEAGVAQAQPSRWAAIEPTAARPRVGAAAGDARDASRASGGRASKGCRTPSITEPSWKTSTSTSCAGEQRPSNWRANSATTLEDADSDARCAADRGPASRGSLPPRAPRPVPGKDVRAAPHNHDSAPGTRARPPRRRGPPPPSRAGARVAQRRLTGPPRPARAATHAKPLDPRAGRYGHPQHTPDGRRGRQRPRVHPMSTRPTRRHQAVRTPSWASGRASRSRRLLLSLIQANVAEYGRRTLARDDQEARDAPDGGLPQVEAQQKPSVAAPERSKIVDRRSSV